MKIQIPQTPQNFQMFPGSLGFELFGPCWDAALAMGDGPSFSAMMETVILAL